MGSFASLTAIATRAATDSGTIVAEIPPATYSGAAHGDGTWLSLAAAANVVDAMLPESPVKRQVQGITPREMV